MKKYALSHDRDQQLKKACLHWSMNVIFRTYTCQSFAMKCIYIAMQIWSIDKIESDRNQNLNGLAQHTSQVLTK